MKGKKQNPQCRGATEGLVEINADQANPKPLTRQQKWAKRNPLKSWAHAATRSAIHRGLLVRPDKCQHCGQTGPVDAHHDPARYHEPLRISAWLCRKCHKSAHRRAKAVRS